MIWPKTASYRSKEDTACARRINIYRQAVHSVCRIHIVVSDYNSLVLACTIVYNRNFCSQSRRVKAVTLLFISGRGSAISSAKQGKSGSIYNFVKKNKLYGPRKRACIS